MEVCSSLKVIKYRLWYPFKGDTQAIGSVRTVEDEIRHYEDMRTVGATEAFWRMYKFDLHARFPSVMSLDIHLEEEHLIFFEADTNLEEEVERGPQLTQLTAFFNTMSKMK